ncbi:hypothetical protein T492DRAFT_454801 [Pavlovales sp. CCMP2436]|nr:hypothetical protein T492DRAFT_454801 [Pavlovales sp. CCMP2436]
MYAFSRDVHSDVPAAAAGGQPSDGSLQTGVLSVTLAISGLALAISWLAVPILLTNSLAADANGNCTSPNYGSSCNLKATRHYWDTAVQAYLTDGCETIAPPMGANPSLLYCACSDLIEFAGIKAYAVPANTDDAAAEISAFSANTVSKAYAASALTEITEVTIVENPAAFIVIFGFSGLWVLTVALAAWRDRAVWKKVLAERKLERHRSLLIALELERKVRFLIANVNAGHTPSCVWIALASLLRCPLSMNKLDELEDRLDQAMKAAATAVQTRLRGVLRRRATTGLRRSDIEERAAARRKREHAFTRWLCKVLQEIRANHTVFSLCFGDTEGQRRAELVQVSPPSPTPKPHIARRTESPYAGGGGGGGGGRGGGGGAILTIEIVTN